VDTLDVRVVLTLEDGEKVVYAQCALDDRKFNIDQKQNVGGGNSSDNNIRNMSVENCANYRRKNPRRVNQDEAATVPPHARRQ
jgi:hypothetical protein